jgi:hypothetical protein
MDRWNKESDSAVSKERMPANRARPLWQFSLQSLLVVTAMVAIVLAFCRLVGAQALVHYLFLVFAVGPWFAWLASECRPVRSRQVRVAAANFLLLLLFIAVLKLAELTVQGPVTILIGLTALLLWTPQYMIFFIWRLGEPG